jgi:ATP-dependent DNA helicase HFM1/MER3
MASIKLFLIDEIHLLGENIRGSIIEVVVSRIKTSEAFNVANEDGRLRFLAISATIPNINDVIKILTLTLLISQ